jgi:hypothetical protein
MSEMGQLQPLRGKVQHVRFALAADELSSSRMTEMGRLLVPSSSGFRVGKSVMSRLTIASHCIESGRREELMSGPRFWGLPNLQVINRDAHAAKCLAEVQARLLSTSAMS